MHFHCLILPLTVSLSIWRTSLLTWKRANKITLKVLNTSNVSRVTSCTPNLEAGMKEISFFNLHQRKTCLLLNTPSNRKSCSPLSITKHCSFIKIHSVSNSSWKETQYLFWSSQLLLNLTNDLNYLLIRFSLGMNCIFFPRGCYIC